MFMLKLELLTFLWMSTITHNSLMTVKSKPSSTGKSDQVSHIKDLPRGNMWSSLGVKDTTLNVSSSVT